MPEKDVRIWEIKSNREVIELHLAESSSLDAVTRQLPQGFYSTFRTFDGGKRALGLRAHLQRLYDPAGLQQIEPVVPAEVLRNHLTALLADYPDEARVRVILTGDGRIYVALSALKLLPDEVYLNGVSVVTTEVQRQNPRLKSTAFIMASESTRTQIAHSEIFEALLTRNGIILEGMTSNFFYVKDGRLGTAREGILLGVTRRTVLRVARGSGISIVYKPLKREQVQDVSEAFITSSSRGIVSVVRIDDITVGEGGPGPMTNRLSQAYNEYVIRHAEVIRISFLTS